MGYEEDRRYKELNDRTFNAGYNAGVADAKEELSCPALANMVLAAMSVFAQRETIMNQGGSMRAKFEEAFRELLDKEGVPEVPNKLPELVRAVKAWVSGNPMWFPDAGLQAWARFEAVGEDLRTEDLEVRFKQVLGVAAAEPSAGPSAASPRRETQTPAFAGVTGCGLSATVPNAGENANASTDDAEERR